MRLWSLHPRYLDPAGLVALWREGLLAQAVLRGATRGYTRHPQLARFRAHAQPSEAIGEYLREVANEASRRGYRFDLSKLPRELAEVTPIAVTRGQLRFEWEHLRAKLRVRNAPWLQALGAVSDAIAHPQFVVVEGGVADWERGRVS